MKNFKLFIASILIFIFVFCSSSIVFGAVYENKVFPDLPEDLKDVVVIIYDPNLGSYRLYTSDFVDYRAGDRLCFFDDVIRYTWYPETSDTWAYRSTYYNYDLFVVYELDEDGHYYGSDGNRRILVYSNVDILIRHTDDFFFQGNALSDFYDFAIATHPTLLPDYDKPSWWDTIWGGIEDFWDSIGDFLGSALSPLFSVMETIGSIFEGFVNALLDIYEAINDFFSNFFDTIVDIFEYIFVPDDGYFESKLNEIRSTINAKFGGVIEMKDNILNSISQIQNKEFEGIKIDLSNFFIPGLEEYYILSPGPMNYYSYRIKPWISGLMLFLTGTYFLRKIVSIIRGSRPL